MDNTENIISFCTGYGGIELGLHRVIENLRTICYVEIETFACANLVAKIEQGKMDAAPIWSDIKTFPAQIFRDKVHGIIGGYPCQPFSHAGKRKGTADPRHLWPYILGHIRTIRPVWCFFENVSGHLTLGFKEVQQSLRDIGYKVEPGKFTAAEVGFPHKRQRLFFLAYDGSRGCRIGTDKAKRQTMRRKARIIESGRELGNAEKFRLEGQRPQRRKQVEFDGTSEQLADTGGDRNKTKSNTENTRNKRDTDKFKSGRWPARPGQEQYKWEKPRTVKPGMGRTVNGFKSRVDELRLLGNGVVPATAELAFRTLLEKI